VTQGRVAVEQDRGAATRRREAGIGLAFGAGFGFVLGAARLHEYATIHEMLRLRELDVFWFMGTAIAVSLPLLWLFERRQARTLFAGPLKLSRSRPERRHVVGGAIFGVGWALAGSCPAPALVLVASGGALGLVVVAGLFVGLHLGDRALGRDASPVGDGEHNDAPISLAFVDRVRSSSR